MKNIVVDKCFLQGAKASEVRALASSNRLIVSDGLFYELITSSEPGRSRCFAKFPATENPVDLVSHIGALMRKEIDTHQRAGKPSKNREAFSFQFNSSLLDADYELPASAKIARDELFFQLRAESESLLEIAMTTGEFFPNLLVGNEEERAAARIDAESWIVEHGALLPFLATLEPPPGEKPLPPTELIDEGWAIYRWLQVKFLFALDIYVRYQGRVPVMGPKAWEKLEHDVLDAQVLALACLEGAFATREKKLIGWWNLLCPGGDLYQ